MRLYQNPADYGCAGLKMATKMQGIGETRRAPCRARAWPNAIFASHKGSVSVNCRCLSRVRFWMKYFSPSGRAGVIGFCAVRMAKVLGGGAKKRVRSRRGALAVWG